MTLRQLELLFEGRRLAEEDRDREMHKQAYLNREINLTAMSRGKEVYKYQSFNEFYKPKEIIQKEEVDEEFLDLIKQANSS